MRLMISVGLVCLLVACTQAIYGVPEAQWQRMTPAEKQAAIVRFERLEQINAQTRMQAEQAQHAAEHVKDEATDFERQCRERTDTLDTKQCDSIQRQRFGW